MTINPWENFKCYVVNRPPVVLFGLGLIACSLTLVVLAVYVKDVGHLENPNVLSWNTFLNNLAGLEYCVEYGSDASFQLDPNLVSINAPMNFAEGVTTLLNSSILEGLLPPKVYAVPSHRDALEANVTLIVANAPNASVSSVCLFLKNAAFIERGNADGHGEAPTTCSMAVLSGKVVKRFTVKTQHSEKHSHFTGIAEACPAGKAYKLFSKYEHVPALDVFFSENDRMVIELHLWHTSYFVIVMVLSLLIYSMLKGARTSRSSSKPVGNELLKEIQEREES